MAYSITEVTANSVVQTNGTLTFPYPTGTTAASFALTGAKMAIRGLQVIIDQGNSGFTLSHGGSDITATYKASTPIPVGSVCTLQLPLYGTVTDLTENATSIGGTNDGNLPDLTATAATVTDSTGGTPDTSAPIALEAVTTPTAVVDLTGGTPDTTGQRDLAAITTPIAVVDLTTGTPDTSGQRDLEAVTNPDLASWDGATVFPSAAQATAIGAAITALKNNQATQSDQNDAIVAAIVDIKNNQATQSDQNDAIVALKNNQATQSDQYDAMLAAKVNALLAVERNAGGELY